MRVIVLGCGLIGAPTAVDLAKDPQFLVTVADKDEEALLRLGDHPEIKVLGCDLSESESVKELVADFDLVLSAVPGFLGFQTLQAVIAAGKNVVDLAFFPEDPFLLDEQAKANDVAAVIDCGVAPGMSNLLVGYVDSLMNETFSVVIYVGGLPQVREWPYEYKAVFSPADVLEEYVRPARYIENGRPVVRPALSDPERIDFKELGTLEAFNTDGLRTLTRTISAPDMKEKTLRYPGHIEKMSMLRETGFFSREPIDIDGCPVRPLDLTSRLLFSKWRLSEGEPDLTIMRILIEGRRQGSNWRYTYNLFDRYDPVGKVHSMARTTGYTASLALRLIARGILADKGIIAPELLGRQPECMKFLLDGLQERGVIYRQTIENI